METEKFTHVFRDNRKAGSYKTRMSTVGTDSELIEGLYDKLQIEAFLKKMTIIQLRIEYVNFSWLYDLEKIRIEANHKIGEIYKGTAIPKNEIEKGIRMAITDFLNGEGLYLFLRHY